MIKRVREAAAEYATSETVVWWDMDNCPLPNGYDPSRVAPRIDTELKSLGYNGPLTIVAGGNLLEIPNDFLKALSSTGVVLSHTTCGLSVIVPSYLRSSHSPVSIMLITTNSGLLDSTIRKIYMGDLIGCNLLLAYPPSYEPEEPHPSSLVSVGGEWLWDRSSLLKVSGLEEETRRLVVDSTTRSCEMFSCALCPGSPFLSFENFIEHLGDKNHRRIVELSDDTVKMMIRVDAENLEALKQSERYINLLEAKKLAIERYHKHVNDPGKMFKPNILEVDDGKYVFPLLHRINETLKNENTDSEWLKNQNTNSESLKKKKMKDIFEVKKMAFANEESESPLLHMIKEGQKKKSRETLLKEREERKMRYEKWTHQHSSEPEKTLMAKVINLKIDNEESESPKESQKKKNTGQNKLESKELESERAHNYFAEPEKTSIIEQGDAAE